MEVKILDYYLKNPEYSLNWISKLFDYPLIKVEQAIRNYNKDPYIIRESKMNYEKI